MVIHLFLLGPNKIEFKGSLAALMEWMGYLNGSSKGPSRIDLITISICNSKLTAYTCISRITLVGKK